MKYSLTGQQSFHFSKYGCIEFADLLDEKKIQTLCAVVEQCEEKRGLALANPQVKKILFSKQLAELAAHLSKTKIVRYGFDQLIFPSPNMKLRPIAETSCIAPIVICLMVCLDGEGVSSVSESDDAIDPFPSKAGHGVFFSPHKMWSEVCVQQHIGQKCLVIAYAEEKAQYLHRVEDPYVHELKKQGLVFGDVLPQDTHPVLWRNG